MSFNPARPETPRDDRVILPRDSRGGDSMRSNKTRVIEHLYQMLSAKGRTVATLDDVRRAIIFCNRKYGSSLSVANPANFMKDIVRGRNPAAYWPDRLKKKKIGGRQRVGEGRVMEFVPYAPGQTDPFENSFVPTSNLKATPLQSISLRLAKRLGRSDESWLIQVAVELHVIEQHFALRPVKGQLRVLEIEHLQTGVKLGRSEVDALFFAVCEASDGSRLNALVTCEAKQRRERIVDHQIIGQIVATNRSVRSAGADIDIVLPLAIQARDNPIGCIYVVEFAPWRPAEAEVSEHELGELILVAESLHSLTPPVPGIGYSLPKKKRLSLAKRGRS